MTLPYRYDVLMRVTVVGDGIHADGNGVMATARKIANATAEIANVVDATVFPADINYLGKNDAEAPDPPLGGTFTVTQGGKTTAPIPYNATLPEIQQAADAAGMVLTFGAS